jgi:hypothetical protein
MQKWTRRGFFLEHFLEMIALGYADLYEDRPRDALARIIERWRPLQRSLLFQIQIVEIRTTHLRGRAALAAMGDSKTQRSEHKRLEREVRAAAKTLVRTRAPWGAALAELLLAGLANRAGDQERALAHLERSISGLEGCDMALHAACARRNRGRLIAGDEGAAIVDAEDRWMTEHGIVSPASIAKTLAPA